MRHAGTGEDVGVPMGKDENEDATNILTASKIEAEEDDA